MCVSRLCVVEREYAIDDGSKSAQCDCAVHRFETRAAAHIETANGDERAQGVGVERPNSERGDERDLAIAGAGRERSRQRVDGAGFDDMIDAPAPGKLAPPTLPIRT